MRSRFAIGPRGLAVPPRRSPVLPRRLAVSIVRRSVGRGSLSVLFSECSTRRFDLVIDHRLLLTCLRRTFARPGGRTVRARLGLCLPLGCCRGAAAGSDGSTHRPVVPLHCELIPSLSSLLPQHGSLVAPPRGPFPDIARQVPALVGVSGVVIGAVRLRRRMCPVLGHARLLSRMRKG
jgi:hypothetical protein